MIYYLYGLNKLLGGENMNKLTDEHIDKMIEVLRFGICPAPVNMINALKELKRLRMGAMDKYHTEICKKRKADDDGQNTGSNAEPRQINVVCSDK